MLRRHFLKLIALLTGSLCGKPAGSAWTQGNADRLAPGDFALRFSQAYGGQNITDSPAITLQIPDIAEDGAVVPLTISSELKDIQRLSIWAEKNPTPLVAEFNLTANLLIYVTARIKLAESGQVIVIAEQNGQLLRTQHWVNVVQGGCGTG